LKKAGLNDEAGQSERRRDKGAVGVEHGNAMWYPEPVIGKRGPS